MTDTSLAALAALIRYHETGGHEGDASDLTLAAAKEGLTALRAEQSCAEKDAEIAALREVVRLYVDLSDVRPEHEVIVIDANLYPRAALGEQP